MFLIFCVIFTSCSNTWSKSVTKQYNWTLDANNNNKQTFEKCTVNDKSSQRRPWRHRNQA